MDLQIPVAPVGWEQLTGSADALQPDSGAVREAVVRARARQAVRRCAGRPVLNALVPAREVMEVCRLTDAGENLLEEGVRRYRLSARSVHRTLRVARTIADLGRQDRLNQRAVAEALRLRAGLQAAATAPGDGHLVHSPPQPLG